MKRWIMALVLFLNLSISGCSALGDLFSTQEPLPPVANSPVPPGIVETLARATLTAKAEQALMTRQAETPAPPSPYPAPATQPPPPTVTLAPTRALPTVLSGKPFAVQAVGPLYTANFANPSLGCAWQGVAGQVLRTDGEAIQGIVVVISGQLAGAKLDRVGMTGNQTAYGPGGYEVVLNNNPAASTKSVLIQLFDGQGTALSEPYAFDTFATCSKNLVIINFQQAR